MHCCPLTNNLQELLIFKMPLWKRTTGQTAHVEGHKRSPPRPPVTSCSTSPLLLFLPPSLLFVLGTYQPERRRAGGGVSQHVRQGERIACGRGTERSDTRQADGQGRKEREAVSFFCPVVRFCHFLLLM